MEDETQVRETTDFRKDLRVSLARRHIQEAPRVRIHYRWRRNFPYQLPLTIVMTFYLLFIYLIYLFITIFIVWLQ